MRIFIFKRSWSLVAMLCVLAGCTHSPNVITDVAHSDPVNIDDTHPPAIVELNFSSHGKRLNGILYQANGAGPHPTVVLLHGYPGNEKNLDLAQAMRRAGFNVLFFHYRGAWGSGGVFSYSHVIEDVASALAFLRQKPNELRVDADRLMLTGHSMGGFAALQGAANDSGIHCVAAIAPADIGVYARAIKTNPDLLKSADYLTMLNGWNAQTAAVDVSANAERFDVPGLASRLSSKSVLLIAGDRDKVLLPALHHEPMVSAYLAEGDIDLTHTVLPGDHSFSWSRIELIDTVLSWARTCEFAAQ